MNESSLLDEVNIAVVLVVLVAAILLIVFMVRKNYREKKKFEEKIKKMELGVDEHKDERI